MNEKLKSELEKVSYSKSNVGGLLIAVVVVLALSFFLFVIPQYPDDPKTSTVRTPVKKDYITLRLSDYEWSQPVRVSGTKCIRWWSDIPDGHEFDVQVRGVNDATWHDWEVFKKLKKEGVISYNMGWVRFMGAVPNAIAYYEILPISRCS